MFVASEQLLNRPDASLTLAVLAVSVVSLAMLLVHALLRRRAEKRITSYARRSPATAQRATTAVSVQPERRTVDLTGTDQDRMVGGGSRR